MIKVVLRRSTEGDTKSPGRQDPHVRVSDIAPRGQLPRQRA